MVIRTACITYGFSTYLVVLHKIGTCETLKLTSITLTVTQSHWYQQCL